MKANEFLYRRVDVADIVDAHLLAAQRAPQIGLGCYVISATTPFAQADRAALRSDAAAVVAQQHPLRDLGIDAADFERPTAGHFHEMLHGDAASQLDEARSSWSPPRMVVPAKTTNAPHAPREPCHPPLRLRQGPC